MSLNDVDMTPWTNWAGNQTVTPVAHCYPKSLDDLVGFVQLAEQNGKHLHAVGSSWSFSDIGMTPDYLVETNQLNKVLNTVNPAALNNSASGRKLLHLEAGIKLSDLTAMLDANAWAVPTLGGAEGQTLAGAISTSVHGSDFDRGPVPEMVRAIHLVGPGGIQHWIEPAQGITDPARLQQALGLDPANIHYDDAWFNSVLVSVGCLGIIYSLIIEVKDQYDLIETCTHHSWVEMRAILDNEGPFVPPNRYVLAAVDPGPGHACFLITRVEAPPTAPTTVDGSDPLVLFCTTPFAEVVIALAPTAIIQICRATGIPVDSIPAALGWPGPVDSIPVAQLAPTLASMLRQAGALGDVIGTALNADAGLTAQVVTYFTNLRLPEGTKHGWSHTIMAGPNPGDCAFRGLALEMAFDATVRSHLSFMDEAITILDQALQVDHLALGGWFSLRFVGSSRAYLSPQRFDRTCMIEIVSIRALNGTSEIMRRLEEAGRRHGGIQHWGMFSIPNLTADDVARAYPDLNSWLNIRAQLTNSGALATFDNQFSSRCGLNAEPNGPPVTFEGLWGATLRPIPVVGKNADGRQQVFALTTDGQLHTMSEQSPGGAWQAWTSLEGWNLAGPIAVANNADGWLTVFVRGGDSSIYYRTQLPPNGDWAQWLPLGGVGVAGFSVGTNLDGRLEVVAVWSDGALHHIWQTAPAPNGTWSAWEVLGGWQLGGPVALGRNADGRLEAFVVGGDGVVYHQWQAQAGQDTWIGPTSLGDPSVPPVADVAIASGVQGRLFVFFMRQDQGLSYRAQIVPNGDWGPPVHLYGHDRIWPLAVGRNPDGRLDVFVIGANGQIHDRKQLDRGHPDRWSLWARLGGSQLQAGIGLGSDAAQELQLYVIGGDANLYRGRRAPDNQTVTLTVQISNILDHIQATPPQLSLLHTFPKATVGGSGYLNASNLGVFTASAVLQDIIPIQIEIWRSFDKVIGKVIKNVNNQWIVDWGALGQEPLPANWQINQATGEPLSDDELSHLLPQYPAPDGLDVSKPAISLALAYSHDLGVISGDASGPAATNIHIPGGLGSVEFDFAISEQ